MEKWLIQVEEVMINSLKKVTEDAVNAYYQTPRGKWVQEWPGQVRQNNQTNTVSTIKLVYRRHQPGADLVALASRSVVLHSQRF